MAKSFSEDELKAVRDRLNSKLLTKDHRITTADLFKSVNLPNWTEAHFRVALSEAFDEGKLSNFEPRRKIGIVRVSSSTFKTEPASPLTEPEDSSITFRTERVKPLAELTAADVPRGLSPEDVATDYAPKTEPPVIKRETPISHQLARHVWIDRKLFLVPYPTSAIENILIHVLNSRPSDTGRVVFNGKRYACEYLLILEKLLVSHMFAMEEGESDPVLDDGSGINVELRLSTLKNVG